MYLKICFFIIIGKIFKKQLKLYEYNLLHFINLIFSSMKNHKLLTYELTVDIVGNNSKTTVIRLLTIWLSIIINSTKTTNFYHYCDLPERKHLWVLITSLKILKKDWMT